jgi:hypothetical protein
MAFGKAEIKLALVRQAGCAPRQILLGNIDLPHPTHGGSK